MIGLVVDNFAGGGGASTGIEAALGRAVDIAINHDPEAVAMHEANHPGTLHYCQSVWKADPRDVAAGRPVALAWFSPDCKHFSKAKGGKPVAKNIRDLAWVVVMWAQRVRPAVIMLENVEEFRTWGPLGEDDKPDKKRAGETFAKWCAALRKEGYKLQWKELRACDYGAPTSRKRFFMIGRRDGEPIVWPEPTHGKPGTPEVRSGKRRPWRAAAEIIDWSLQPPSIFDRKRPLEDNTNRRIAAGVMRYVVNAPAPFIVPVTNSTWSRDRAWSGTEPLRTATTAKGGEFAVVSPTFVGCGGRRAQSPPVDPSGPYPTSTAKADACLVETVMAPAFVRTAHGEADRKGRKRGRGSHGVDETFPTVTASQDSALMGATLVSVDNTSTRASRSFDPGDPVRTITASGGGFAAVAGTLIQTGYGERAGQAPRALDPKAPLGTVVAGGGKHAAVSSFLSRFYGSNSGGGGDLSEPARTESAGGNHTAIIAAHMEQANTGMVGHDARKPVSTIVGRGTTQRLVETTLVPAEALPPELMERAVLVAAFLIKYYGSDQDPRLADPLHTITTKDRFAVVTVTIDAATYILVDIGMRMLTPRELARAQGFPDSYVLEPIVNGKPLTKTAQTRMIGNSVCPPLSEALVRANFPVAAQALAAA